MEYSRLQGNEKRKLCEALVASTNAFQKTGEKASFKRVIRFYTLNEKRRQNPNKRLIKQYKKIESLF